MLAGPTVRLLAYNEENMLTIILHISGLGRINNAEAKLSRS